MKIIELPLTAVVATGGRGDVSAQAHELPLPHSSVQAQAVQLQGPALTLCRAGYSVQIRALWNHAWPLQSPRLHSGISPLPSWLVHLLFCGLFCRAGYSAQIQKLWNHAWPIQSPRLHSGATFALLACLKFCFFECALLGTLYRYESSGTLHGLFRVRGFTQVHFLSFWPVCILAL